MTTTVARERAARRDREVVVIEPRRQRTGARFGEMWRYRRLIPFFGRRSLEKMYARTTLGWSWVVLRPLLDTGSKALIFGGLLSAPSIAHVPYFLFFLTGMAIWAIFDRTEMWATRSIELNRKLVAKMYFPRIILPVACTAPALAEFGIYIVLVVLTSVGYAITTHHVYVVFGPKLLLAPIGLFLIYAMAIGIALFTSVLGASRRDVRFTMRYLLSFWYVITPVIYPMAAVPGKFRQLASLNPLAPLVELVRLGLFGVGDVTTSGALSAGVVLVCLWFGGLWFFGKAEAASVDQL